MASKIEQPDFFAETQRIDQKRKPYQYITEDEFMEFVKNSLARLFKSNGELMKLNEFLILSMLESQDKIIEHEEEINQLKNP